MVRVLDPGQVIKLNTMENPYGWESAGVEIMLGNSSDELIQMLILAAKGTVLLVLSCIAT